MLTLPDALEIANARYGAAGGSSPSPTLTSLTLQNGWRFRPAHTSSAGATPPDRGGPIGGMDLLVRAADGATAWVSCGLPDEQAEAVLIDAPAPLS